MFLVFAVLLSFFLCVGVVAAPKRIVSLAPSITEILFELGLGDRVVGVTRYCDFPDLAAKITKVGGFMDPNYEEILILRPDLTILLSSHQNAKRELQKMNLRTLTVPHTFPEDVHRAIRMIGEVCGREDQADLLLNTLGNRVEEVRKAVDKRLRPRLLICIGRDIESGGLSGMYIAGKNDFYDKVIELAGGVNACTDESIAYPQVSAESVIELDPDVIVDLVNQVEAGDLTQEEIAGQWDQLPMVSAVREGRVHVVVGSHSLRPGPRYVQFLEKLAQLLHPESSKEGILND
jgi:iron complex transport system substrate-binding protein